MTHIIRPDVWYFPSNHGDIRLEQAGEEGQQTQLIWYSLTSQEAKAMEQLRKGATHWRRRWASDADWKKVVADGSTPFPLGDPEERRLLLDAPVSSVGALLTKHFRPDREAVHVMRIGQGKIHEFSGFEDEDPVHDEEETDGDADVVDLDTQRPDPKAASEELESQPEQQLAKTGTDDGGEPAKVATVKKPVRGCPAPDFEAIRLRANRVLRAFLTPDQVEDFERYQRFVTVGADTGHQYMLTSRSAPDELRNFGARCVFDLDENRAYCVHDWDVPAEEELLSLHCLLSVPGYETWARGIPDHGQFDA